jgi:hypothetical protein
MPNLFSFSGGAAGAGEVAEAVFFAPQPIRVGTNTNPVAAVTDWRRNFRRLLLDINYFFRTVQIEYEHPQKDDLLISMPYYFSAPNLRFKIIANSKQVPIKATL